MSNSMKNLKEAFAGESQANRSYLAFAAKAEEEGYPLVAKRFRVAAASETVHAINHLKVMGGVKSTAENLDSSISGENYEHTSMYPSFMEEAEKEDEQEAKISFDAANQAEKFHEAMFKEALDNKDDVPDKAYFVCQVCGMSYENEPPEKCVVCRAPRSKITEVK